MRTFLTIVLTIFSATVSAQTNSLIISNTISLPRDTVIRKQILTDLEGFISQKEKPNKENSFVLKENLLETSVLLDELKEAEKHSSLKVDTFFKAHLLNILKLNDSTFKIQIGYIGISENIPVLKATFSLVAQKKENRFYFNSPLKQNTANWKSERIGNTKIYFKNTLNTIKANEYFNLVDKFDKKLNAPGLPTEFYCCDNFNEALQLIGVDYKTDFNGRTYSILTAIENNTNLMVNGTPASSFTAFDPHDIWHSRLHNVLPVAIINKPVDEGTAYLYGGSWGFTWEQILEKFKTFASANPKADWIALYNESKNFDEKAKYPLNVDMVINALIVRKLENEKGFSSVMELLSCGKQEKQNENYFAALEKIAGISKTDFNATVWSLINTD